MHLLSVLTRKPGSMNVAFAGLEVTDLLPTMGDLSVLALREVSKMTSGSALRSLDSEPIPELMRVGAANTTGAYFKSAFWAARAARVAMGAIGGVPDAGYRQVMTTAIDRLKDYARKNLTYGDTQAAYALTPVNVLLPISTSPTNIYEIFQGAIGNVLTIAHMSPEIRRVLEALKELSSTEATLARQDVVYQKTGIRPGAGVPDERVFGAMYRALSMSWLGSDADDPRVVPVETDREATGDEQRKAKEAIATYENIAKMTSELEQVKGIGISLRPETEQQLTISKRFLVAFSQPVNLLRSHLGMKPIGAKYEAPEATPKVGAMFGVAFLAPVAAALGVEVSTLVVAGSVAAAIIILAVIMTQMANAQQAALQTQYIEETKALQACISSPDSTSEQRRRCKEGLRLLKPPKASGPEDMLWAGAALLAIAGGVYALGPAVREVGQVGAGALRRHVEGK